MRNGRSRRKLSTDNTGNPWKLGTEANMSPLLTTARRSLALPSWRSCGKPALPLGLAAIYSRLGIVLSANGDEPKGHQLSLPLPTAYAYHPRADRDRGSALGYRF